MLDPLSVSVATAGVDTSLPLLPEADYIFQVAESSIDPNKDQVGLNWNLKLVTTAEVTATDGRPIKPNFPVFTVSALQAKDDSKDPQAFIRNLGQTIDAIFATSKDNRPDFNYALAQAALGKSVIGHVIIDTYQGRQSNKIKALKPFNG